MITQIIVPDLGATGAEVVLCQWLIEEGQLVVAGQPLFIVETDKATQEVEAFQGGYLRRILVGPGTTVEIGAVVAILSDNLDEPLGQPAAAVGDETTAKTTAAQPTRAASQPPLPSAKRPSSPAARHLAGELGVDLDQIIGSGPMGEIRLCDVKAASTASDGANTPSDRCVLDVEQLLLMYRRMSLIRRYEDHLYRLFLGGQVPGTLHQCQGQEAVAVGVCTALRRDDVIFSTHRPVGHLLAKQASLRAITAELWGKATGCAGGKGGQMHLVDVSVGAMPSNAIVGANIPIATGAAIGFQLRGLDRVAVSFFGDGAANIGAFHEGINLAAVRKAPVIFVCENNLYAASTHISLTTLIEDIADRAAAYGIPGRVVDGMDVVAVYDAALEAVERARQGGGPTLLECKTYRYPGHSRGDPGNYRTKDEYEYWRLRDPIDRCRSMLIQQFGQTDQRLDEFDRACQSEVDEAVHFAIESPEPEGSSCFDHVFAERGPAP